MVERCVSYLYITWNDTTQCVPVSYTVMLTNTSSGVVLQSTSTDNNSYNFTGLTSDTSYTITITGRNRAGQNVVMNTTSSLISEGKVLDFLVLINQAIYMKITVVQLLGVNLQWQKERLTREC